MTSEITDKDIKTAITNILPMSRRYKLKRDTQKALKGNNNNNKTSRDEKTMSAMENTLIVITLQCFFCSDTAEEKINLKTRSQSNYPK